MAFTSKSKEILSALIIISLAEISVPAVSQAIRHDTLPQINLPDVTISALRIPFKESTVPYSISLIKARINIPGLSLSESISGLPGLEINARYNYAVGDRITNRGFGARTQFGVRGIRVVFDDVPVTLADGQTNLEMIDIQNLSTVELLRGPGSSIYGNSAGGVLILYSAPISGRHLLATISSTSGSDGLFRWNGAIDTRPGSTGRTGISCTYTDFRYAGFRKHASAEYQRAFLKLVSKISDKNDLQIEAGAVKFNALNPGSLTREEYEKDPRQANPSSIIMAAGQDGSQVQLSGIWKHKPDSSSLLKLIIYTMHRSVVNPVIGKIVVLPQHSIGAIALYNSRIYAGNKTISWSIGTEVTTRFNYRKNYLNNKGEKDSLTIDQNERVIGTGVFLQEFFPVTQRLNIDGCFRYDLSFFGVRYRSGMSAGAGNNSTRIMKALDPSLGLIYKLSKSISLFTNVSTSFETPTTTELANSPDGSGGFNPGLNPAHATEYESGVRGVMGRVLTYDIASYLIATKDELIPFQVPATPGLDYYRNAGSTRRLGAEVTVRYSPESYIDFRTSMTCIDASYNKFIVQDINYSGYKIPGISHIHTVAEIKFRSDNGIYLSFLSESFGRMYVNDSNTATVKQHTIFGIGLGNEGYNVGKDQIIKIIVSGGISNLFGIKYITAVTVNAAANRYYEPGPGRTFYINCRLDFGSSK